MDLRANRRLRVPSNVSCWRCRLERIFAHGGAVLVDSTCSAGARARLSATACEGFARGAVATEFAERRRDVGAVEDCNILLYFAPGPGTRRVRVGTLPICVGRVVGCYGRCTRRNGRWCAEGREGAVLGHCPRRGRALRNGDVVRTRWAVGARWTSASSSNRTCAFGFAVIRLSTTVLTLHLSCKRRLKLENNYQHQTRAKDNILRTFS